MSEVLKLFNESKGNPMFLYNGDNVSQVDHQPLSSSTVDDDPNVWDEMEIINLSKIDVKTAESGSAFRSENLHNQS